MPPERDSGDPRKYPLPDGVEEMMNEELESCCFQVQHASETGLHGEVPFYPAGHIYCVSTSNLKDSELTEADIPRQEIILKGSVSYAGGDLVPDEAADPAINLFNAYHEKMEALGFETHSQFGYGFQIRFESTKVVSGIEEIRSTLQELRDTFCKE